MTITQQNYLDIGNLLINELFGDVILFILVGLAIIVWASIRNRIPHTAMIGLMIIWVGLVTGYYYNSLLWMLALLVVGLLVYVLFTKVVKK